MSSISIILTWDVWLVRDGLVPLDILILLLQAWGSPAAVTVWPGAPCQSAWSRLASWPGTTNCPAETSSLAWTPSGGETYRVISTSQLSCLVREFRGRNVWRPPGSGITTSPPSRSTIFPASTGLRWAPSDLNASTRRYDLLNSASSLFLLCLLWSARFWSIKINSTWYKVFLLFWINS